MSLRGRGRRHGERRTAAPCAHQVHPRADPQTGKDLQQAQIPGRGRESEDGAETQSHRNSGMRTLSAQTTKLNDVLRMRQHLLSLLQPTKFIMVSIPGEDLVPKQEDEAEAGGARLPRSPSPTGDVPASAPGSVSPRHGCTATPLHRHRPGLLPVPHSAAGPSAAAASSSPTQPTFLLINCQLGLLLTETLKIQRGAIQSYSMRDFYYILY